MTHIPYTQRSIYELQIEIDRYEDEYPHDQLPARYDALVALRNKRLREGLQTSEAERVMAHPLTDAPTHAREAGLLNRS